MEAVEGIGDSRTSYEMTQLPVAPPVKRVDASDIPTAEEVISTRVTTKVASTQTDPVKKKGWTPFVVLIVIVGLIVLASIAGSNWRIVYRPLHAGDDIAHEAPQEPMKTMYLIEPSDFGKMMLSSKHIDRIRKTIGRDAIKKTTILANAVALRVPENTSFEVGSLFESTVQEIPELSVKRLENGTIASSTFRVLSTNLSADGIDPMLEVYPTGLLNKDFPFPSRTFIEMSYKYYDLQRKNDHASTKELIQSMHSMQDELQKQPDYEPDVLYRLMGTSICGGGDYTPYFERWFLILYHQFIRSHIRLVSSDVLNNFGDKLYDTRPSTHHKLHYMIDEKVIQYDYGIYDTWGRTDENKRYNSFLHPISFFTDLTGLNNINKMNILKEQFKAHSQLRECDSFLKYMRLDFILHWLKQHVDNGCGFASL